MGKGTRQSPAQLLCSEFPSPVSRHRQRLALPARSAGPRLPLLSACGRGHGQHPSLRLSLRSAPAAPARSPAGEPTPHPPQERANFSPTATQSTPSNWCPATSQGSCGHPGLAQHHGAAGQHQPGPGSVTRAGSWSCRWVFGDCPVRLRPCQACPTSLGVAAPRREAVGLW